MKAVGVASLLIVHERHERPGLVRAVAQLDFKRACHPERSAGGKAGVAQSRDLCGSITFGALSDRRGPSTTFRPTFARPELRSG